MDMVPRQEYEYALSNFVSTVATVPTSALLNAPRSIANCTFESCGAEDTTR